MAAPQRENGFTGIAHEILEAVMKRRFRGLQQLDIVLALWRETWGWNRVDASLSLGLLERHTGIPRHKCSELLAELVSLQVVEMVSPAIGKRAAVYRFQKDYDLWQVPVRGDDRSPTGVLPHRGTVPPQGDHDRSPQGNPSKKELKKSCSSDRSPTGEPSEIPDLTDRVVRQLTHLQPSGLSQEDRKTVAELLRNTDKTPRRVLEAVTDATRETQQHRRNKQLSTPVRYALRIAGRMLSEPEPMQGPEQEFVRAPEGWCPPGYQSRNGAAD